MYIHYSTGNISGPRTLVRIVEVSVIGGVHFWRFHCILKTFVINSRVSSVVTVVLAGDIPSPALLLGNTRQV